MIKNTLTTSDIMDLISDYKSEIRKLYAKISFCENRILELEELIDDENIFAGAESDDDSDNKLFTRPRKRETKPRKPYPLSDWDQIILDILRDNGKAQLSKDIYEQAFDRAKEADIFIDETKSKAKINQCLVKLTSRRNDIVKVRYGGRGFAYCLPEWIDDSGKIKSEYI